MSFWCCVFYVIANVIAWILHWQYHQERQQQQRLAESGAPAHPPPAPCLYRRQQRRAGGGGASLLTMLGLTPSAPGCFYAFEDRFSSFQEVSAACRRAGLGACGLIVGVDFSASNEWQGRKTFQGHNLHRVLPGGKLSNPYQKVISILGRTLEPFDDDALIPAYGFGDQATKDRGVFCFMQDADGADTACRGVVEVLARYSAIAASVVLSGPTDFAPVIRKAVDIVRRCNKYHILILIADGQVTQQPSTVQAIVEASKYPLSIVMVGVGDGPWDTMDEFDNAIPERAFDNFQFVDFHGLTRQYKKNPESSFALHAMMEIPDQYKTIKALGYLDSPHEGTAEGTTGTAGTGGTLDSEGTVGVGKQDGILGNAGTERTNDVSCMSRPNGKSLNKIHSAPNGIRTGDFQDVNCKLRQRSLPNT